MSIRPHDVTDLYLSPVALELDRRLQAMTARAPHDLDVEVALSTNSEPTIASSRAALMLAHLTRQIELHGWQVSWEDRGLGLRHGEHMLTLGLPDSVRQYIES